MYLFYGPGQKNKTARQLAKEILGKEIKTRLDFIIVKKPKDKTRIPIELIRETIRTISLKSINKRVVWIKRAELLTEEASNALLKTLEEPPTGTTFILSTANIRQIIPTIVSRCQGYYLGREGIISDFRGREKRVLEFLKADLVERFNLAKEIAENKVQAKRFLSGIELCLRDKMLEIHDSKAKKCLASEIKKVNQFKILLNKNISVRIIIENLGLMIKIWPKS